jgi:hypothetical protein
MKISFFQRALSLNTYFIDRTPKLLIVRTEKKHTHGQPGITGLCTISGNPALGTSCIATPRLKKSQNQYPSIAGATEKLCDGINQVLKKCIEHKHENIDKTIAAIVEGKL